MYDLTIYISHSKCVLAHLTIQLVSVSSWICMKKLKRGNDEEDMLFVNPQTVLEILNIHNRSSSESEKQKTMMTAEVTSHYCLVVIKTFYSYIDSEQANGSASAPFSSSHLDEHDGMKHVSNNVQLECKRREDIKKATQVLKEHIPSLSGNPKAPIKTVLLEAAEYINTFKSLNTSLTKQKREQQRIQRQLQARLAALKQGN